MKLNLKPMLLAGLLATAGFAALAQAPGCDEHAGMMGAGVPMHEGMGHHRMVQMDPARMQARIEKRHAALKVQLKLTPAQEGAWTAFSAAMLPPAGMMAKGPDFAELAKLSTPERIDKLKALHTQQMADRSAAMDKRGEATKTFYAALSPEQQKTFDSAALRQPGRHGPKHGPRHGSGDHKGTMHPAQ